MLLVDTSAWIDFFANRPTIQTEILEYNLRNHEDICICGVILTEILQGIRQQREFQKVRTFFSDFNYLSMNEETFVNAAEIYRSLRRRGVTIRKPIDCMIAAVALEYDIPLLHRDHDFEPMERLLGLKTPNHPNQA